MVKTGWIETTIGALVDNKQISIQTGPFGTVLSASEYVDHGIPVISVREIRQGRIELFDETPAVSDFTYRKLPQFALKPYDLVFARKGNIDRSALIPKDTQKLFLGSDGIRLRFSDPTLAKIVFHYVQSSQTRQFLTVSAYGTTMAGLNEAIISSIPICIPAILNEQQRIAEALSNMDELIASLEKMIAKKKAIKQGAMQELLTGKRRLPGFIGEWERKLFGDLFEVCPNNVYTRDQLTIGGKIKNIHYGDILTKYTAYLDGSIASIPTLENTLEKKKYTEKAFVQDGDIIIADTAEDLTVGKAVEIINVSGKILSGQHTFLCRPIIPFAPMYLGYYLNSADFHNQLVPYVTGTKVSSINKSSLCNLTVKYPDIPEQTAIAETLSDMDKAILALEERLAKTRRVKHGMMQQLLTGKIRIV